LELDVVYEKYILDGKLNYDLLWKDIRAISGFRADKTRAELYKKVLAWYNETYSPKLDK